MPDTRCSDCPCRIGVHCKDAPKDKRKTPDQMDHAIERLVACRDGLLLRNLPGVAMVADEMIEVIKWAKGETSSLTSKLARLDAEISAAFAHTN